MNPSAKESPETSMFKSYMAQKFFNACNSLFSEAERKDLWLDSRLYPFFFFAPKIYENIAQQKKFELVFSDNLAPETYAFDNNKLIVLLDNSPAQMKRVFEKLEIVSDKAFKNKRVGLGPGIML